MGAIGSAVTRTCRWMHAGKGGIGGAVYALGTVGTGILLAEYPAAALAVGTTIGATFGYTADPGNDVAMNDPRRLAQARRAGAILCGVGGLTLTGIMGLHGMGGTAHTVLALVATGTIGAFAGRLMSVPD